MSELENVRKVFAERLEILLRGRKKLAIFLDVNPSMITHYTSGKTLPRLENLIKIADYFDVSVDYLLGRTNNRKVAETVAEDAWMWEEDK